MPFDFEEAQEKNNGGLADVGDALGGNDTLGSDFGDSDGDNLSFEGLVDIDGDRVSMDKATWEEVRKQKLAHDDYQRTKSELMSMMDKLKNAGNVKPDSKKRTKGSQAPAQKEPAFDEAGMQQTIDKRVQDAMMPLLVEQATADVDRETAEFCNKYSFLFTGEAEKENALLAELYNAAASYSNSNGTPLSLEQAFYLLYGDQLMGYFQQVADVESKRRSVWGSDESDRSGQTQRTVTSLEDADKAFDEAVSQMRF